MSSRRVSAPLLLVVLLAACPAPNDDYTPQIPIAKHPLSLCQISPSLCDKAPAPGAAHAARVHVMKPGEELKGPNVVGRPGDLVLENDEVVFVIDQLGSSYGFAESGGNLVDAADAHERVDELGQVFTYFGTFPRQAVYTGLSSGVDPDGAAWVEARGRELYEAGLEVTTRYTLHPPDRALLIETSLTNTSDQPFGKLSLGDAVQWGGAEKIAPGKALGFRGPSSGPYLGGIGRFTSYGLTSTAGAIDATNGGSWSDTVQAKDLAWAPRETKTYARVFVVGPRADLAGVVSELTRVAGGDVGELAVDLVDEAGHPVKTPAGAKVILSSPAGADLLSLRATHEGDALAGEVPPGSYVVGYVGGGGRSGRGAKAKVDVAPGKGAHATVTVSGAGALAVACTEAGAKSPCKITLEGLAGAATPDLGPAHVAGPARNQVTTADGTALVPLAPGRYRVTLSRGPEYALTQLEVDVADGPPTSPCTAKSCELRRVVDTRGYLATDFHQHTMLSADAAVAKVDRVIANAAEGVEVAVASEHNWVADFMPIVRELGLASRLVEIAGDELTTDASKKPWGHANVFPWPFDPAAPRGGAPAVKDRTAHDVFEELRANKAPFVLQVNHPRTGITGYFDQYGFDPEKGVGTDPGYDPGFDAVEVWNGRNVDGRAKVVGDWLALLRTQHFVTPTADTDTHGIVFQEAGYPRTYVRMADDAHLDAWDASRSADLVRGVKTSRDVVLTNGPFLRVSANGQPIGGLVKGRDVVVKVDVECAPWVSVNEVALVRVNGPAPDPKPVKLVPRPDGSVGATVTFTLHVDKDDAFAVLAKGDAPLEPVLSGDPKGILPWAMTGAIAVDADGDGKALGR